MWSRYFYDKCVKHYVEAMKGELEAGGFALQLLKRRVANPRPKV
jgi:hypothetical protein